MTRCILLFALVLISAPVGAANPVSKPADGTRAPMTQEQIDKISPKLQASINKCLRDAGVSGFELDKLSLKESPGTTTQGGIVPQCHLECTVGGFPPKVDCHVVCE